MSILYTSLRVGKDKKIFKMYKFRTLKEGTKTSFASQDSYAFLGKFLRKYKLDETPQLFNVLKGDMSFVGPRPEEKKMVDVLPLEIQKKILSVKPGMTSLSSLFFFNEEEILQKSIQQHIDYWTKVKPMKVLLDTFYVDNKCFSLDCWILWQTAKTILKRVWKG